MNCQSALVCGHYGRATMRPFRSARLCISRNAAIEALTGEDTVFEAAMFKRIAVLWCVVPFEAFDQPPGFGGR